MSQHGLHLAPRLVIAEHVEQRPRILQASRHLSGIQFHRAPVTLHGFFQPVDVAECLGESEVSEGIVRIEADNFLQAENGLVLRPQAI